MLVPLSWIKDYVKTTLPVKKLAERLTEIGLAVESVQKEKGETILDIEVTPNRPDWLSMVGVAQEIAAIEKTKVKYPSIKNLPKLKKNLLIKIVNDYQLVPRNTAVIIDKVKVKPSPSWMKKRLKLIGLRPINNLVDITNYVMFELGNPLHAFDYDQLEPKQVKVTTAKGGEEFTSVDELSYKLPKGAIILKDSPERIIDLCGIKGGLNSGISSQTKTVFLHAIVHHPTPIRRTCQALNLSSDASYIFERGANFGGTLRTIKRAANLILQLAGGKIASEIFDLKKEEFEPKSLKMRVSKAQEVLGLEIPAQEMASILKDLNLSPKIGKNETIKVTVPTQRGDLKIEEDLIEEVARIHGYNRFPLTLPQGEVPVIKIPHAKGYHFDRLTRDFLKNKGFSEIFTYSLISQEEITKINWEPKRVLKITNPVSLEYEYLRPTLIGNLLKAVTLNQPHSGQIRLFELGRVYLGQIPKTQEPLNLAGAVLGGQFLSVKGIVELLAGQLGLKNFKFEPYDLKKTFYGRVFHPFRTAELIVNSEPIGVVGEISPLIGERFEFKKRVVVFDLDFEFLLRLAAAKKKYSPVSKYPAMVEDLAFTVPGQTLAGHLITAIETASSLIQTVKLIDSFENTRTFRITFQSSKKTLTDKEVKKIREKIIRDLKTKFKARLKGA